MAGRGLCSKAREWDCQTVVQPCIWFKKEPSQISMLGQPAQSLTCSLSILHIQGWMNVQESYSRALEQGTLMAGTEQRHHRFPSFLFPDTLLRSLMTTARASTQMKGASLDPRGQKMRRTTEMCADDGSTHYHPCNLTFVLLSFRLNFVIEVLWLL